MAFSKYAKAQLVKPSITLDTWEAIRTANHIRTASQSGYRGAPIEASTDQVSLEAYAPDKFMLSHCTIIASVDTEVSAEPLGKHMVEGVQIDRRYPDWMVTPQTVKYINNNCFVAGTMILMADGTEKPIEQVEAGDSVVSHTGSIRQVTETFVHPFRGYLRVVNRLGDQRPLEVSPEHPFYAMTPATTCACGCGTTLDRRSRKAAAHRFQDFVQGHGARSRKNPKPGYSWVSAGFLGKGDFLSLPRLQGEVEAPGVTPGKARLLGYYLAEGFYHRQKLHRVSSKYKLGFGSATSVPVGVSFGLNLDETDTLVAEIRSLLMSEFGVESSVARVSDHGVTVYSQQSVELIQFIKEHATEYATTKKLAARVLQWPLHLQRQVVQGWLEGDGCVEATAGGWVSVTSASSDLISQMHVIFARLGVFATRHVSRTVGRKRVRVANGGIQIVDDPSKACVSHRLQVGSVHAETLLGGTHLETLFNRSIRGRKKHTLRFRAQEDRMMFPIRSVTKRWYDGPVYNFETATDHSYVANGVAVHNSDCWERKLLLSSFKTFVGGENYVEHIQIPELSKGKIIDAASRDIGDSIYVDILVATDRKHAPLISAITTGHLQTLSMGCQVAFTCCTKCGNVAEDEPQLCKHIRYMKGNDFYDALGNKRKIAELCGHISAEPGSVKFIEASWVANPAFTGAVLRSILAPSQISPAVGERIQVAFNEPVRTADPSMLQKAARKLGPTSFHTTISEDFDFDPSQEQTAPETEPPKPDQDPLDKLVGELADTIKEKAIRKLREQMEQGQGRVYDTSENQNNTLIREACKHSAWRRIAANVLNVVPAPSIARRMMRGLIIYKSGGWRAVRAATDLTGREMLALSRIVDKLSSKQAMAGEGRVYRAVLATGGPAKYPDTASYIEACAKSMGRVPNQQEIKSLVIKGRIYECGLA